MSNELIVIEQINALQVFANENGLDPVIDEIRKQVRSEIYDVSTKEGRERIGSIARKIGSAKRDLKKMSQGLTEDWQRQTKAVTLEASRMEKELDALRDEIKAPLDEYNDIEKSRIAQHEQNLDDIRKLPVFEYEPRIEQVQGALKQIEYYKELDFEEFIDRANAFIAYSEKLLTEKLETLQKQEAEKIELERLRAEKEAQERQEHENKLKADAAENARLEAEAKAQREAAEAKAESDRKAKEAQDKADAEKKKIQDQKDAADKKAAEFKAAKIAALKEAEEAETRARQKLEDEKQAAIDEAAKREANKKHRGEVNNNAHCALVEACGDNKSSRQILDAIINGKIPHVTISY